MLQSLFARVSYSDLLADGAVKAKGVLARSKPPMTKQEYLAQMDGLFKEEEYEG